VNPEKISLLFSQIAPGIGPMCQNSVPARMIGIGSGLSDCEFGRCHSNSAPATRFGIHLGQIIRDNAARRRPKKNCFGIFSSSKSHDDIETYCLGLWCCCPWHIRWNHVRAESSQYDPASPLNPRRRWSKVAACGSIPGDADKTGVLSPVRWIARACNFSPSSGFPVNILDKIFLFFLFSS